MDFKTLLTPQAECGCGREHSCPIDFVEIGPGAIGKAARLCEGYKNILLVADENTYAVCGEAVCRDLGGAARPLILSSGGGVLIPDENALSQVEAAAHSADLIFGVGAGVINDICKYVSFRLGLPYFIAATAPSMDGYASAGAALILEGMKVTENARPPKAILADTDILRKAPMEMLQAGYGDIIGKYSCLSDWRLSALLYDEYFCPYIYDMTMQAAKRVERLAEGLLRRDAAAVETLMEALVAVGIFMHFAGSSRPASGSEHHLSHFFEITGILENTPYLSHGVDVAFSSVVTARLREEICAARPEKRPFDRAAWEAEIRRVYTTSAPGVIRLQDGLGWYAREDGDRIAEKWDEICALLREAPTAAEFTAMLEKADLHFSDFTALYGEEKIRDAVRFAKDLKDRYTVLWLYDRYFAEKSTALTP